MDQLAIEAEDQPYCARVSRAARSAMMSNTGCTSVGDSLITFSTSAVAVCRSQRLLRFVEQPRVLDRDHRLVGERLRNSASSLSPNGRGGWRNTAIEPMPRPSQNMGL